MILTFWELLDANIDQARAILNSVRKIPILKLPRFHPTYTVREKRGNFNIEIFLTEWSRSYIIFALEPYMKSCNNKYKRQGLEVDKACPSVSEVIRKCWKGLMHIKQ